MSLIDTHSHIYYDQYKEDLSEVLDRAAEFNVEKIICVAVDIKTANECLKLTQKYTNIYMSAGIHPHESKEAPKDFQKQLEPFFSHPKTVAVGEIGLDYHYNFSDPSTQMPIFLGQLELAKSVGLPTIVHCREAENDILNGIKITKSNKGVIHCFSGGTGFAKQILRTGYKISFTGLITFTGTSFKDVIKTVDLTDIMIETDSPYLTPIPFRGKRNEPGNVRFIAQQIADWKNISFDLVAKSTTKTAYKVFPKLIN